MTADQHRRGTAFRDLHLQAASFVIPNPFDIGSAKLLAAAGFQALATSSAGFAFSQGCGDHAIDRSAMLAHLETIVGATDLPVSADLEAGYADDPAGVAETIALAAETGIVGASIEDATGNAEDPLYPLGLAAERIKAAAEVLRGLDFPFMLTARAENLLVGKADLSDVIRRLQAYQEAGADVLYAPGLVRPEDISTVVRSIDRPLNVLAALPAQNLSRSELDELGVKRISLGSSIARSAYGAVLLAAEEMQQEGSFSFGRSAVPYQSINTLLDCR
jgi:2-methylisocitrate lyase-like PEP mutase family enzyme